MENPTLFLIRHGQTPLNQEGRIRAWLDVDIAANQRPVIQRTGSQLALHPLQNPLYSSDLTRAISTAKIIGEETFLEIVEDRRLRPWDVGEWSGRKISEIAGLMQQYIDHPSEVVPGGESWNTFFQRWTLYFQQLVGKALKNPHEAVVAVTHSRNIETARFFVTRDKSTLVTANSIAPGRATSWQVIQGKLVEVPVTDIVTAKEEKFIGETSPDS